MREIAHTNGMESFWSMLKRGVMEEAGCRLIDGRLEWER